jgi:plastocyanin
VIRSQASLAGLAALVLATAAQAAPKTYEIDIADLTFGPAPKVLHVGDTIVWVNKDMFRHTATARDGSFDLDLQPNARGQTRLGRAGTISFYCRYHPGMTGKLNIAR